VIILAIYQTAQGMFGGDEEAKAKDFLKRQPAHFGRPNNMTI
jgi:hypothetical protein